MNCNTTHYRANSSSVPGDPTFVPLGTDNQPRWLAVQSRTDTAHLYFPEATKEPAAGLLPDNFLVTIVPADGLGPMRRAGITHVVVTYPEPGSQLDHQAGYRRVWRHGTIAIFAVEADAGSPSVGTLLQPAATAIRPVGQRLDARLRRIDAEAVDWTATADQPTDVVAAIAYDPAWHVTVDGRPVATSPAEGLVQFHLSTGRHRIAMRFTGSRNDWPAIALTLVALAAVAWIGVSGGPGSRPWTRCRACRRAGPPPRSG